MEVTPFGIRLYLLVVLVASGILLIWMALATASGRLKRNHFAGIRTPSTMASDAAWLAAHRRTQKSTVIGGTAMIVSGLVAALPLTAWMLAGAVLLGSGIMVTCLIAGACVGGRAARAVTAQMHASAQKPVSGSTERPPGFGAADS